jgi:hypothetical protein
MKEWHISIPPSANRFVISFVQHKQSTMLPAVLSHAAQAVCAAISAAVVRSIAACWP